MGQDSENSVRKAALGVQSPGLMVQWVFAAAQSAHMTAASASANTLFLCFQPAATQPEPAGSW